MKNKNAKKLYLKKKQIINSLKKIISDVKAADDILKVDGGVNHELSEEVICGMIKSRLTGVISINFHITIFNK